MRTSMPNLMKSRPSGPKAGALPALPRSLRSRRFARRGNAMIMAVALTVLLAIIGSSFVLMSRLDRQSVRNASVAVLSDAALDAVIAKIQKALADSIINPQTGKLLDQTPVSISGNNVPRVVAYDYPEPDLRDPDNGVVAKRSSFLASIEPKGDVTAGAYIWPHVSDLDGVLGANAVGQAVGAAILGHDAVDADGDGIPDAVLFELPGVTAPDVKKVYYAVRIIDNCGMVNVNTAWKRKLPDGVPAEVNYARTVSGGSWDWYDSYGEFRHQIDLYRLIYGRYGLTDSENVLKDVLAAHDARMSGKAFNSGGNYALESIWYDDLVLRDYGWFGMFPSFVTGGLPFRPFGLDDEYELRNRGTINTTTQTPLEAALGTTAYPLDVLGVWDPTDPTGVKKGKGYRILPYSGTDDLKLWFMQMTNHADLATLNGKKAGPRADQRHLFTTYSFDRELRLRDAANAGDDALDGSGSLGFNVNGQIIVPGMPGKFRKVNVNTVLRLWTEQQVSGTTQTALDNDSTNPLLPVASVIDSKSAVTDVVTLKLRLRGEAARRLAMAFVAAGYNADEGFQFLANLIDYIDVDSEPTVINPANSVMFPAGLLKPSRMIYGTERQPYIIEVFNRVEADALGTTKTCKAAAVELFNPYDQPMPMQGLQLWYDDKLLVNLATDGNGTGGYAVEIPARGSVVYSSDATLVQAVPSKAIMNGNLLTFDPTKTNAELCLVRVMPADVDPTGTNPLVLDRVRAKDMEEVCKSTAGSTQDNSIWRGISLPSNPVVPPTPAASVAPWGWANNLFCRRQAENKLGNLSKLDLTSTDTSIQQLWVKPGISIAVANRGAVQDAPAPSETYRWRVGGWYDLSRILFVGNPDLTTLKSTPVAEDYTDKNNNGKYDLGEDFVDANNNGVYDAAVADVRTITERLYKRADGTNVLESDVRLDLQPLPSGATARLHSNAALINRISLVSRTDDRLDNENADGDNNWATNLDSLMECRVAGRVNVNTAPRAVLKALFPALSYDAYVNASSAPTLPSELALDTLSSWFADAVIDMRAVRPFESLADFANRLSTFTDPNGVVGVWPQDAAAGRSLWFGRMIDAPGIALAAGRATGTTIVGDPYLYDDAEERDWIFSRLANLITVRSDTFTAYILIRVEGATDTVDKRYVAILDRSNVFLPKAAAQTGLKYADTSPANGQYDKGELYEHWDDANKNGIVDAGELIDANGNGVFDPDESGEMAIYDPSLATYGPDGLNDPDYFDRQYTTPKVVAIRQTPDAR